jgi:Family of unknown function (DUF6011)
MKINLDKQFFFGGNATFTVDNGAGEHFTFKISQPKQRGDQPAPYFLGVLSGPDNESNYSYMGIINPIDCSLRFTKGSKVTAEAKSVKVALWALKHAITDGMLPAAYQMRHEGTCGCCGRKLTHPESLDRGIGPECWSRLH